MTAIGLVLFFIGVILVALDHAVFEWPKSTPTWYMVIGLITFFGGAGLFMVGLGIWLWRVMP
jgi:hypothetical protein